MKGLCRVGGAALGLLLAAGTVWGQAHTAGVGAEVPAETPGKDLTAQAQLRGSPSGARRFATRCMSLTSCRHWRRRPGRLFAHARRAGRPGDVPHAGRDDRPGDRLPADPKGSHWKGKLPGIVVVNGHGSDKFGWYAFYSGMEFAKAGAVVVTYDMIGEGERTSIGSRTRTRTTSRWRLRRLAADGLGPAAGRSDAGGLDAGCNVFDPAAGGGL